MLVGVLVTFLVVILVLYLINMLPMDGREHGRYCTAAGAGGASGRVVRRD